LSFKIQNVKDKKIKIRAIDQKKSHNNRKFGAIIIIIFKESSIQKLKFIEQDFSLHTWVESS